MVHSVLTGQHVTLRAAAPADAPVRVALGRHVEILRMYGMAVANPAPYTLEQSLEWVEAFQRDPLSWVIEHDGAYVGEARLHSLVEPDARATFAIGLQTPALLGRGIGTAATRLVLAHAFEDLGLHRVGLRVLAFNTRAIHCYEKAGFQIEGRERESACVGGHWHDDIIMGALAGEHRAG